jgi:hypothetical protein
MTDTADKKLAALLASVLSLVACQQGCCHVWTEKLVVSQSRNGDNSSQA